VKRAQIQATLQPSETRQHREAGELLFLEGEAPAGVYTIYSGEVDLLFAARKGNLTPLRVATSGQILGLSAVVSQRPHDCSAVARVACDVGFIPREEFMDDLDERPGAWFSVLRHLSSDVNGVYDDMRAFSRG